MVGETGDKISSFDAMLSFLTWREALLKSREKKELTNQKGSEQAPNQVEEKSKKVLAEMKLLYPLEFAKSGDSSFLKDCVLKDTLPQDEKSKNDQKEKIISQEIDRKSVLIEQLIIANPKSLRSHDELCNDANLGQVFLNDNLKNKIRASEDVEKFCDLDRDLKNKDISKLESFVEGLKTNDTLKKNNSIITGIIFFQESVLDPLNALYHTGLSALGAGIVSIANLCSTQQQKSSPGVDVIQASIEKLKKSNETRVEKSGYV